MSALLRGSPELKPVGEQTIVITGATSGIGLATARLAAERGARVVLVARDGAALRRAVEEIEREGGEATYAVADVADPDAVRGVVETAEEAYGGFDTWANVAGAFLYGRLDEKPVEEMREQFDTNVWGLLHGSLEAADHLKRRGGGAVINVGSAVSDRAIPLQGSYSASKHAVKGFTDSLRMELEEEGAPVSVTLVKPASVDTPYPEHARDHMDEDATLPPPVYDPETVALAILDAAETPQRDVYVGGGARGISLLGQVAPSLADTVMETLFFDLQKRDTAETSQDRAEGNLEGPADDGTLEERGRYQGHTMGSSAYTAALQRNRGLTLALAVATLGLYLLVRALRDDADGLDYDPGEHEGAYEEYDGYEYDADDYDGESPARRSRRVSR